MENSPYIPYHEGEFYDDQFIEIMQQLNGKVALHREPLEGNYFYPHGKVDLNELNFHKAVKWRQNLLYACKNKQSILEIGLNAGHSALAILYHNKEALLHSVDICSHNYTPTAAKFLSTVFPGRFFFYSGDSTHVLPRLRTMKPHLSFDLIHIDGGHGLNSFLTDFFNSLTLVKPGSYLVIDDVVMSGIGDKLNKFITDGLIELVEEGWQHPTRNVLVKVLHTQKPNIQPAVFSNHAFSCYKNSLQ